MGATPAAAPRRLEIGRIGRPHGLRGEVTAVLVSDRPERTAPGAVLFAGDERLTLETARPHRDGWILGFAGVEDRAGAEGLRGRVLYGAPLGDVSPADGEADVWWVDELVGAEVVERSGRVLGRVQAVEANPAHDLLVLESGVLVPTPFVVERAPGRLVVDVPDGLLDL